MSLTVIIAALVLLAATATLWAGPGVVIDDGRVRAEPVRGPENIGQAEVVMPRTWMTAPDALTAAHRQAGLLFAAIPPDFDAPVGPFELGQPITVEDLAARVAKATGTRLSWTNGVAVFDPPQRDIEKAKKDRPLARVSVLDAQGDSGTVIELTQLAGHDEPAVRLHALAALDRLEGDFKRNLWPGRVSILEVLADRIDRDGLLFALEAAPLGGRAWKLAAEALGRSREPVLSRNLWWHVYLKRDGVEEMALWGLGRCGDPSGAWSMRNRVEKFWTNEQSHRYLAAMALGQCDSSRYLGGDRNHADADVRRAVAFGLGFCKSGNEQALEYLLEMLADKDSAVRFVACQSLARLGAGQGIGKLTALAGDAKAAVDLRVAAITGLTAMGRAEAVDAVFAAVRDDDAKLRAAAAELLGDIGGPRAVAVLADLAGDADPSASSGQDRYVRCAAVCALARLGTDKGIAAAAAVLADETSDADLKISALLGLGRSHAPAAADPLAAVAHNVDAPRRLRNYAVLGLARLADRAGQKQMVDLARIDSPKYLPLAVRYLQLKTPRKTAEFLIPYLTHGDRNGACSAGDRLAELGYGPGVVELLEGSDVFDNHTRNTHMWGAVRASGREVSLALAAAADSKRASIRRTVAFALGERLWPEAVDALLQLARDKDTNVRIAAARSLGTSPDPRVVDTLIAMATGDADLTVAREAAAALRRRDFRGLDAVKEMRQQLAGTERDPGGLADDPPSVADQSANTFVLRSWADHVDENLVCNLTYESSLCYDSHTGRVVQWGAHGRRYDTPQQGQTWFFDAASGRWTRELSSRVIPLGVCGVRGTAYDRASRAVVSPRSGGSNSHGWHHALRAHLAHGAPWVYDVPRGQWYAARGADIWAGGYMPGSHDPRHAFTVWWKGGKLKGFDVYANRWLDFDPEGPNPGDGGNTGGVFDPKTGRFIAVGGGSTWSWDPAEGRWTDLKPAGDQAPACPMVYDSTNDVMLSFRTVGKAVGVWVYHIRENRWERQPDSHPCPARGDVQDAAFDERNNVAIIGGTHTNGLSASLNLRETWTYRYKPAEGKPGDLAAAVDVQCTTADDGSVKISWQPGPGPAPAGYRIERGVGDRAWQVTWEQIGEAGPDARGHTDTPAEKKLAYYRVIATGAGGVVAPPSLPARTAPRIVSDLTAGVLADGGVRLAWTAPPGDDVAGYHVYRVAVDLGDPWQDRFEPHEVFGDLARVTDKPVAGVEFVDKDAKVAGPADALTWPKTHAYVVRPINAWGIEGGASPLTLALPEAPGRIRSIPWADGRRLVLFGQSRNAELAGYHVMRMDDWWKDHVFRLGAAPLAVSGFWDDAAFPLGDRRRYSAVGVDVLGTLGEPTSGDWARGMP